MTSSTYNSYRRHVGGTGATILQQYNVINLRMLANCCVRNSTSDEILGLQSTWENSLSDFYIHFNSFLSSLRIYFQRGGVV